MANKFSYEESALLKGYIKNAVNDINLTARDVLEKRTHIEKNPLVQPIINNVDAGSFRALGAVSVAGMLLKWAGEKPDDRKKEMLAMQLIEAAANNHNGDDWQIEYGFNF